MISLAAARVWFAHHHAQALAAGGAGVVGVALYRRHQNAAAGGAASSVPVAGQTPSAALGYGDPGSAQPTFSDPAGALLDADLQGVQSSLDGIRATLANLNPRRGATAKKKAAVRKPKRQRRVKTSHKGAKKKVTRKNPRKAPASGHEQHQRTKHAARQRTKPLPSGASERPRKRATTNPRPSGHARPATPVAHAVATRHTLAAPGPRPAPARRR